MSEWFMKSPCKMCHYRRDVDFKFREERVVEFANITCNPYNSFPCHKTADLLEDDEDGSAGYVHGETSKECAGFLTMQVNAGKRCPEGFEPSELAYEDYWEMIERYTDDE